MNLSDRDLLAKTLQAEAGNQGLGGMLAAGSVIMNRTQTPGYGSGLRGVILKPGQFSAWNSLTGAAGGEQGQDMLNMRPSAAAYQAADKLLTGDYQDQTGGATHYYNPSISNPKWGQKRAGGDWQRIGDHIFGFADAGRGERSPQATVSTQGAAPMMQQEEQQPRGETAQPFYQRDSFKDTAAILAQGFGRLGIMGMEEIADNIAKQRTEIKAKNKTVEFLRKSGRADLADAVANNVLGARDAASMMFAKPKTTAKEQQIQRLMSTGVPENIAIGIADGRLVVSRDPVTGEATIVDKAQLMTPGASPTAPVEVSPQEVETAGKFEGKNVKGALGAMGFGANILNTVVDVLGGEQPADKISDASTALQGLAVTTELGLAAQFPGRPSNLTRERIAELTIRPGELTLGKGKALNKAENMVKTIEDSLSKANAVLVGRYSPADVSAAKESIALLTPLLADYNSLVAELQPTTPAASGGTALRPEVVDRLGAY
jgi:hypothetical protein